MAGFLAALPSDRMAAGSLDSQQLGARLEELYQSARARWPQVGIARRTFYRHLAERLPAAETLLDALGQMCGDDLYLACGCAAGDPAALAAFESEILPVADHALRRLDGSGTIADEARQQLRERLFVALPGKPARIGDYLGHGDLRRWVRAAAVRIGIDVLRAGKREDHGHEDDRVLAALPDTSADPELAHLQERYGAELKASFRAALDARSDKEQTLLRYHYIDGLTIDQIGSIYQVHRTTAFRWLEAAKQALVKDTRKRLQSQLAVSATELDSILRLVRSQLDLSIRTHFAARTDTDS